MNATAYSAASGGAGMSARRTSAIEQAMSATCVMSRSFRRSTESATAPPPSEKTRIGMSWTIDRKPTASRSLVRT